MRLKRKIAVVVAIIFLIFLVAFSFLLYVASNILKLEDIKYKSSQLLSDMHYLHFVTQSILSNSFKSTEELREDLTDAVHSFENTLKALVDMSNNRLHQQQLIERMQIASRLWYFTKEELAKVTTYLDKLIESGIEKRKGPMNSIGDYHSHMPTKDLYKTKDHYYIILIENSIDMVLAGAYSYNATLQRLVSDIKDRANTFIRLSLILSILLISGFVISALLLVYLFSHQALAKQVDKLLSEAVNNVEERRKAELKALQFQINPHFLYNTLGSIRLTAVKHKDQKTADMLRVLSRLLRKTTSREPGLVMVEEEITTLEDYIYLLQIRYKNRIQFSLSIDEAIKQTYIPGLLFQPLVENAILHGLHEKLNQQEGDAELSVTGYKKGDHLYFTVYDNGCGMHEADIRKLFEEEYAKNSMNGHIGIKNIHERIVYSFGKQYGLTLESKPSHYTEVHIHLPVILAVEEKTV
jgi:sensor histidine kinase YesM